MATMLNGAAVMDAALLLIAANEPCPQPQTSEHLAAIEIMKLKHILVLQVRCMLHRYFACDNATCADWLTLAFHLHHYLLLASR